MDEHINFATWRVLQQRFYTDIFNDTTRVLSPRGAHRHIDGVWRNDHGDAAVRSEIHAALKDASL